MPCEGEKPPRLLSEITRQGVYQGRASYKQLQWCGQEKIAGASHHAIGAFFRGSLKIPEVPTIPRDSRIDPSVFATTNYIQDGDV